MKRLILTGLTVLFFSSCSDYTPYFLTKKELREYLERAYFYGQEDAVNGDVRIKRNTDGCWIWSKSPWDDGDALIYNPSFNCK